VQQRKGPYRQIALDGSASIGVAGGCVILVCLWGFHMNYNMIMVFIFLDWYDPFVMRGSSLFKSVKAE
jgi:hypothetical protein